MVVLLLENGAAVGTAAVQQQGRDTLFSLRASLPAGLWRLVARGSGGELLLGTVEGGSVQLCRPFSRRLTEPLGAVGSVVARAVTRMESEWRAAGPQESPRPLPPGSLRRGDVLALPWHPGDPFPWEDLFCFAAVGPLAGRCWVFYRFDSVGCPVMPPEK